MSAKHKGHNKHLCVLFAGGDGLGDVAELARGARYVCVKCGRAAKKKRNLCKAAAL